MEPVLSAVDYDRRAELLAQLASFVQRGINLDVKRQLQKLDEIAASGRSPRYLNYKRAEISHLRSVTFEETMDMLDSYATETLELVALSFTEIKDEHDCLHSWLSYNGKEWNSVTGGNRDVMFRDILALRRYGWTQGWNRVHALLDTYRALDLSPGSIHLMEPEEMHIAVAPAFKIACASRTVLWLRMGPATRSTDRNGDYTPPVERDVPEEYRLPHLSSEAVEYVAGSHERYLRLWEYMKKRRETLYELDFDLFLLAQEAHSSVADGVL